jgi:hypothetical protein
MTDARTAFEEILSEVAKLTYPCDDSFAFRFAVEYLTRRQVCFQFRGRSRAGLVELAGRRLEANRAEVTVLPGSLVVAAIADFADNPVLAFYTGSSCSTEAVANEMIGGLSSVPEVLLLEISSKDLNEKDFDALTRVALIGFCPQDAIRGHCPDDDIALSDELLHAYWCQARRYYRQDAPPLFNDPDFEF